MKFTQLIMVALCTIALQANAQTEKGKNLIGGSVNFLTANTEQGTSTLPISIFHIG